MSDTIAWTDKHGVTHELVVLAPVDWDQCVTWCRLGEGFQWIMWADDIETRADQEVDCMACVAAGFTR